MPNTTAKFERAMVFLFKEEGGYINDSHDAGGETKYGISKRRYPLEDIPNLTKDRAKALYFRDYWNKNRCEDLPGPLALAVFDAAVNGGQPIKWLQIAVDADPDGIIGPKTIAAANKFHNAPGEAVSAMLVLRLQYMMGLANWPRYKVGWMRRLFRIPFHSMS